MARIRVMQDGDDPCGWAVSLWKLPAVQEDESQSLLWYAVCCNAIKKCQSRSKLHQKLVCLFEAVMI